MTVNNIKINDEKDTQQPKIDYIESLIRRIEGKYTGEVQDIISGQIRGFLGDTILYLGFKQNNEHNIDLNKIFDIDRKEKQLKIQLSIIEDINKNEEKVNKIITLFREGETSSSILYDL